MLQAVGGNPTLVPLPPEPAPRRRTQATPQLEPVVVSSAASSVARTACSYLGDAAWRSNARKAFTGADLSAAPDETMLARADALAVKMRDRLKIHLQLRITGNAAKGMRSHYSFLWFHEQIPRLAAVTTLAGHAVGQPGGCSAAESMLKNYYANQDKLFSVRHRHYGSKWGAYLWVDADGNAVRSGKAAGAGGFLARDDQHLKCATNVTPDSARNYRTFPSKHSGRQGDTKFEDLHRVVALGFDPADGEATGLLCGDAAESIFSWGGHLNKIKGVGFAGEHGEHGHQLQFVAYALELAYDLLIAPGKNVSDSPGFETPIGYHVK